MKNFLFSLWALLMPLLTAAQGVTTYSGNIVAEEGAWCWFADPRALHYENEAGTINATYIGYIDVHGNVKATQYDWVAGRKTDVLIRSFFQPDDHNNPTFVVLPDERVMIFYTRHTDEAKIWYRISQKPGDITALGEEKYLATANNTTYPSPFILSDDPQHIYLCWRGINWHPTLARLTMPDAADDCRFDFGPKQIVQSTGARPYAKYQSNGKDKIYLSYTTGHPDNEMPDWLYFNVIDINHGNGPILRDINGQQLKKIADGAFNVNKQSSYASSYAATIVDNTSGVRNWVWQVALDADEHPVIAYPHIDNDKTGHEYWYARWTGSTWRKTKVANAGHAFHQNWNQTERCYSGGMSLDPDRINDLYLSIPTKDGTYNRDGVYEIWRYTVDDGGNVSASEQLTRNSVKNNARPFVIPGSKNSKMRVGWMNGDYYYWMVNKNYPKGYPTDLRCDYAWQEEPTPYTPSEFDCICFGPGQTFHVAFAMNAANYQGKLLIVGDDGQGGHGMSYAIDAADQRPVITVNGKAFKGQNRLLTSDDWATNSTGTSGDNHPTKLTTWILSLTFDGKTLISYRNGFVDQVIELEKEELWSGTVDNIFDRTTAEGHAILKFFEDYSVESPFTVQRTVAAIQERLEEQKAKNALQMLSLPAETRTDLVLPTSIQGLDITWVSSNEAVISALGVLFATAEDKEVTLTATIAGESRAFQVKALARDIAKNLRYELPEALDLTANTAAGFATNRYGLAPQGLLKGLRSYTFLLTANVKTATKQPRLYDFGSGSGNSLFLRADALSAGIKYNGGTTTLVTSPTKLQTGTDYKLAVSYDAATRTTRIYINGKEDASGTANQTEAYQLAEIEADTRNYIGRTQWWEGTYAADNQDFCGTIDGLRLYDVCLTQKEICELQGLPFEEKEYPTAFVNGDFEDAYAPMADAGVRSDRAIYVPEGWTLDYATRDENDLTALRDGDFYFSQFFATKPQNSNGGAHTLWIRQRWNPSVLNYHQDVLLEAGAYELKADLFATDNSANNTAAVYVNGIRRTVSATNAWQTVSIAFEANGADPVAIGVRADHQANEFICAFDNLILTRSVPLPVHAVTPDRSAPFISAPHTFDPSSPTSSPFTSSSPTFDLTGRRTPPSSKKGLYISNRRKLIVNK